MNYEEKIELLEDKGLICNACSFFPRLCPGYNGVRGGPNGPICPPCADKDAYDYIDPDKVEQLYQELVEEGEA